MKTREEVDALKLNWQRDPIWDIEDTEGFEEYRDELIEFHKTWSEKCQADWEKREKECGGGSAFPVTFERFLDKGDGLSKTTYFGMTLRDYFAGQALAAIVSTEHYGFEGKNAELTAMLSYGIADAMLAERKK